MPSRKPASPASALGLDAPEQSAVRSPAPPGGGGGGSPSGANQASNASAGISTIGRGVSTAGRYLEASEEQQRAVRKRNEAERIQGAAEARADRGSRDINRWQFSNSPNYRTEYQRLFKSHYDAKILGIERSLATTKDPEAIKGLTKYLETLQKNHATETNAIYGDEAERPDRLEDGKELFRNATLDVRGRLTDLGFAEHRNLIREIDAREDITPEQRYEEAQQVGEAVADSYFPDDDEREHFLRITGSANDALLRNEQAELRKAQFDRQADIIDAEGEQIIESLGRKTHKLFEVGEDGKVSTNGNVLTEFLAEGEILGQFTLPRYDDNGEFINEPAYNEKAINAILAPLIGDALIQHAGRSGDNGLAEQIEAQDFKWREHRIDENGDSEVVEFQLDTDIADRIREAAGIQASNTIRDETIQLAEVNKRIEGHTPIIPAFKKDRQGILAVLPEEESSDDRKAAIRVLNSAEFERVYNEESPNGVESWKEFIKKVDTGEILPAIAADERVAVSEELSFSINEIAELPIAKSFEQLTGEVYPPSRQEYPTQDDITNALSLYKRGDVVSEENIGYKAIIDRDISLSAELLASGFPITNTRLDAYRRLVLKGDDAISNNVYNHLQIISKKARTDFDASPLEVARGKAETMNSIWDIHDPAVKSLFLSGIGGGGIHLFYEFASFGENKEKIAAGITPEIRAQLKEFRGLELGNVDTSYMTQGEDPLWGINPKAEDLLFQLILQDVAAGAYTDDSPLGEASDYYIEDDKVYFHFTGGRERIISQWKSLITPPEEAPYFLLDLSESFLIGQPLIGVPKMIAPNGQTSTNAGVNLTAIRNLIFDPELATHPINKALEFGLGEGGNVDIYRFKNTILGGRRFDELDLRSMRLIPSEEGVQFIYPSLDGEDVAFPAIIPWEYFTGNLIEETGASK